MSLDLPPPAKAGAGEVGHQGLKTPQWSAVRRGRSGWIGPVLLARARTLCAGRRSAPSLGVKTGSALLGGAPVKKRTELARISAARTAEHVQAKWVPVRRPDMRQTKNEAWMFDNRIWSDPAGCPCGHRCCISIGGKCTECRIRDLTFHETLSRFDRKRNYIGNRAVGRGVKGVKMVTLRCLLVALRYLAFSAALAIPLPLPLPASAAVLIQIDKSSQRMTVSQDGRAALHLAGLDRKARAFDAVRIVQGLPHGEGSLLARMGRRADAEFHFLHQDRPRHPWQL